MYTQNSLKCENLDLTKFLKMAISRSVNIVKYCNLTYFRQIVYIFQK